MTRRGAMLGALLGVASCSALYEVTFEVSIDAAVRVPAGVTLRPLIWDGANPKEPVPVTPPHVISDPVATGENQRVYTVKATTCCAPNPTVVNFAYLDLDGDGFWTAGEPFGVDPASPVVLRDNTHVAKIVIRVGDHPPPDGG